MKILLCTPNSCQLDRAMACASKFNLCNIFWPLSNKISRLFESALVLCITASFS